eukprot:COSAG06_NODE_228_length_19725_cov_8.167839_11_plen_695_part_00
MAMAAADELCIAAQQGDCGKLRELLGGGGASVVDERTEVMDTEGQEFRTTALYQAVYCNQHSAVELLLERKANPNLSTSDSCTPLMAAARMGHLPILRTLLDRKAIAIDAFGTEYGITAFHHACFYGNVDCAVELARRGCDMTRRTKRGETGKDIAERKKHQAVVEGLRVLVAEQLRAKEQSDHAANDQHEDLSPLLATGATIMDELCLAAENGDCDKLHELLDGGGASRVNERIEVMAVMGTEGQKVQTTLLIQAVLTDRHSAVELLLERKADPNLADSLGLTPLFSAAAGGHLPVLRTLLDREAAIDAVSANGHTAFHVACNVGRTDCAVELVRQGCNTKLHGVLSVHCKLVQKLALRKAPQQQPIDDAVNSEPAAAAGGVPQADEDAEQQKKAAKKAVSNRKKKDRKKAKKKAAQQLLISQSEPEVEVPEVLAKQPDSEPDSEPERAQVLLSQAEAEPEPAPARTLERLGAEPALQAELQLDADAAVELQTEPEPELDERTQQLHALTELGVQQWSAAQVLEWVALADLPPESISVVSAAVESLDLDGEELLAVIPKTLHKKLAKHGAQDAEALAKQVMQQRDALLLLLAGDASESKSASPKSELSDILECPLCMELYCDDQTGLRVPRMLTSCGHTVCHGCIANMLTRVLAEGNAKPYKCPTCSKVTKVPKGKAASLPRNFALAAALEAL